jgi:O-antigen/teichoic acid export membrane protein
MVLGVAIDMGQNVHLGRLVAREAGEASSSLLHVVRVKPPMTVVVAVAAGGVVLLLGGGWQEAAVVALMTVWAGVLSVLDSLRAVARALGRFTQDSWVNGLESLLRLGAILVAWALSADSVGYAAAFVVEAALAVVAFWVYLDLKVPTVGSELDLRDALSFLRDAAPLGVSALVLGGFYRLDQVLVRALAGGAANGLYSAATRLAFTAMVPTILVGLAIYPDLARSHEEPGEFASSLRRGLVMGTLGGVAAAVALFVLSDSLVSLLYGSAYQEAGSLVRILCLVVGAHGVAVVGITAANALGRERRVALVVGLCTALGLGLDALWLPSNGALAAAWVSAASEIVLGVLLMWILRDAIAPAKTALVGVRQGRGQGSGGARC